MHSIIGRRFEEHTLPWRRSALLVGGFMTAVAAFEGAGLDYDVHKSPLKVAHSGRLMDVPGRFCLVRDACAFDAQPATLAMVSGAHTVLQNMDLARALDDSGLTARWTIDAVGQARGGQTVYLALSMGGATIAGEPVRDYALLTATQGAASPAVLAYAPVRDACENAMLLGVRAAAVPLAPTYAALLHLLAEERPLAAVHGPMSAALALLTTVRPDVLQVAAVLEAAFPAPADPRPTAREGAAQTYDNALERAFALRRAARGLLARLDDCDGHPANRGTAWNLYQAIIQLCNHREGHLRKDGPDSVAVSALYGPRSLEMGRAFAAVRRLVDGKRE